MRYCYRLVLVYLYPRPVLPPPPVRVSALKERDSWQPFLFIHGCRLDNAHQLVLVRSGGLGDSVTEPYVYGEVSVGAGKFVLVGDMEPFIDDFRGDITEVASWFEVHTGGEAKGESGDHAVIEFRGGAGKTVSHSGMIGAKRVKSQV